MNIGRRLFASFLPVAPLAAPHMARDAMQRANALRAANGFDWEPVDAEPYIEPPKPPGLDGYWKAREAFSASERYRSLLGNSRREAHQYGMPPSIDCLRSVSHQHKHHMMVNWLLKREKQNQTFMESLMDQFGVRDWFSKQNHGVAEASRSNGF